MSNWVLLRGLAREARHWGDIKELFQQTFPIEKITLQDLAGNGVFYSQRSSSSEGAMVEFAREQLASGSVKPPYRLLAMSLGAMVACEWAARYPQEIERLVLINTSMRPFSHAAQRLRPSTWPYLAAMALRWRDAQFAEQTIFDLTCQRTNTRSIDEAAWLNIRATAPVSVVNVWRQLLAAARHQAAPLPPGCPVLLLSSRLDALVNPICSHQLATAWQAEYRQHPLAGHDLPHDDARWVCQQIAAWLELDAPL